MVYKLLFANIVINQREKTFTPIHNKKELLYLFDQKYIRILDISQLVPAALAKED